ncbi:MAG: NAD(P)/FAD-dependent oxidoreductase [Fusobacteriaceae bacterium]
MKINVTNIVIKLNEDGIETIKNCIIQLGIPENSIQKIEYSKRSIDSRKKSDIKLVYNLEVTLNREINLPDSQNIQRTKEITVENRVPIYPLDSKIAVIGTGPAGLFAAYSLCKYGYSPILFERGEMVDERDESIRKFIEEKILNTDSNIQFGEGGAGTYSDGKLNTRIKSGYIGEVFDILIECGAQKEILYDYKPHIGTDVLKIIVKNIREKIKTMGGKFYFQAKLTDIIVKNETVEKIEITYKNELKEVFSIDKLVLAPGHSSRETYYMLNKKGVAMENKPFAVGARIEHTREFIDSLMFGKNAGNSNLGTATYSLTHNNKSEMRGTFSFCMCPGGVVVNASSEENGTLVNGMSYSDRMGDFSNSALVVGVHEHEFGTELFSGLKFQEKIERKAYEMAGGHKGIFQNTEDFLKTRKSKKISRSSYEMDMVSQDLNDLLPEFITENMKSALNYWNKIHKGFVSSEANLIGPETRTSAPVKILRDLKGESLSLKNLYPIGEGAGYAGGITSAAVDGLKIIDLAFTKILDL